MADIGPHHHPEADLLLDYAAGKTSQAGSVLVATHLALCPTCRREVRDYESLGGLLMETTPPESLSDGALSAVLARLDDSIDEAEDLPRPMQPLDPETVRLVPEPLRSFLSAGIDALPWKTRGIGVREAMLDIGDPAVRTSLVRIAPGGRVLSHTHGDVEHTLVLKGAYSDGIGRYARGDVCVATPEIDHTPVADMSEECLCLIVVEGGLKFTGPFSRLLNPLMPR
ncbi:ChrR family anti-sigma-E factor [Thalassobaculum sp. OXR-137]|uniref:ChrR family anti-sigma-E factor n=1 Tax=Thalassobaculum sp. OXR-137 TaxID=3100173 RepID=UPI002AC989BD|nr:ChrR family anti-sigma-E factor [Thalassobaculum sp. OXR-137]WPZ36127.1 ChrR family anti-sigma-E factor [Thalassobaculum sp. OXR-137]